MAAASSGALDSAPAVTTELSVCRAYIFCFKILFLSVYTMNTFKIFDKIYVHDYSFIITKDGKNKYVPEGEIGKWLNYDI